MPKGLERLGDPMKSLDACSRVRVSNAVITTKTAGVKSGFDSVRDASKKRELKSRRTEALYATCLQSARKFPENLKMSENRKGWNETLTSWS